MNRANIIRAYTRYFNPALARLFDLAGCPIEASARGTQVFDEDGNTYLDFAAGYGVFGIGHANQRVQAAVLRQMEVLATAPAALCHEPAAALVTRLAGLLPGDLRRVFLTGSGSEAVEIALRTALLGQGGRTRLIAATNGYHGKTLGALGLLGQDHLRRPFEPLWPDVCFVPYGDAGSLGRAIGDGAAAVLLEPVLGGGYITVPPDGYLTEARRLCDRTGTLLIIDEVQTGFGRTGRMFAIEQDGIVPDMLILSKGITGGHTPMAAVVVRDAVADTIADCTGQLFRDADLGGSPLVCAAANAALDVLIEDRLPQRAAELGPRLLEGLRRAANAYPDLVLEGVGRGLMTGARLRNSAVEYAVWLQLLKRGVIGGLSTNTHAARPIMRFFPPLVVQGQEIDAALNAFQDSLRELSRWPGLVHDLANRAIRLQHHLPKWLLRIMARLYS